MQADQAAVEAMFARMLEDGLDLSRPLRWGFYFVDADRRPLERVFAKLKEHGYELQDLRALDDGEGWMLHVCKTEVLASDKLHRRNVAFNELAAYCEVAEYDGWEVDLPPGAVR